MADLQATRVTSSLKVQQNTYVKLDTAYISSGGPYAHLSQGSYYTGGASWNGSGPALQLYTGPNTFRFLTNPATVATVPFTCTSALTTIASNTTKFVSVSGNSTTNSAVGIGAAVTTGATNGKLLVDSGDVTKPFLEVTNCDGDAKTNSHSSFKGWLAVKIGSNVGTSPATAGTWYIQLWA